MDDYFDYEDESSIFEYYEPTRDELELAEIRAEKERRELLGILDDLSRQENVDYSEIMSSPQKVIKKF